MKKLWRSVAVLSVVFLIYFLITTIQAYFDDADIRAAKEIFKNQKLVESVESCEFAIASKFEGIIKVTCGAEIWNIDIHEKVVKFLNQN